jgi:hypothetical protein
MVLILGTFKEFHIRPTWSSYWVLFKSFISDQHGPHVGYFLGSSYLRLYPFGKVLAIGVDTRSKPTYKTDTGSCVWILPKIFFALEHGGCNDIQLLLRLVMLFSWSGSMSGALSNISRFELEK